MLNQSITIVYSFNYDPTKPIIGWLEVDGKKYPYTEIIKEPEQLDLWGNPLIESKN